MTGLEFEDIFDLHKLAVGPLLTTTQHSSVFCVDRFNYEISFYKRKLLTHRSQLWKLHLHFILPYNHFSNWNDKNPDKSCWPEQGSFELITNFKEVCFIERGHLIFLSATPALSLGADESGFRTIFNKQYQLRDWFKIKDLGRFWSKRNLIVWTKTKNFCSQKFFGT